jgi:oxygen-independent coproporphyrinogen-3 oxidase
MQACDEDCAAEMILQIESRLEADGFQRYEISNYARPGARSEHNSRYWQRQAVLGLGMGAHSTEARSPDQPHGARRANPRTLEEWLNRVDVRPGQTGEGETLSVPTARGEAVFLALRQREGLSACVFEAEFGGPPREFFEDQIDALIACGWLSEGESAAGDLCLTGAGRLMADSVGAEFVSGS